MTVVIIVIVAIVVILAIALMVSYNRFVKQRNLIQSRLSGPSRRTSGTCSRRSPGCAPRR